MWKLGVLALFLWWGVSLETRVQQPKTVRLWEGRVPLAQGDSPADIPFITLYPAPKESRNGAAVVVCPGGGYGGLAAHEAEPVAKWLNKLGVSAFVLTYRLGPRYHHPVMSNDVSRAIRMVRANAKEWEVDPKRIGVLGFSAGGHLASTAETHFAEGDPAADDSVERVSSRPDLAVLIYPVITLSGPYAHTGSRNNLLGENPPQDLIALLSNEKQVTEKTPPTFLVHGADDKAVPCENSLLFAAACRKRGVPVELHIYEHGEHGFGIGGDGRPVGDWVKRCAEWMKARGFFQEKP